MTRVLQMDFQPIFMAGLGLRKVDRSHWSALQKVVVPLKRPSCSICGFVAETKRGLIHADEVWSFTEPARVTLVEVRPLCVNCHEAKDYAELLRRIMTGKASASRAPVVFQHYCEVNQCSSSEFDADFREASERCRTVERVFGWNLGSKLVIEYGEWDRPQDKPRLSAQDKRTLRHLYADRDEPIVLADRPVLASFGAAVRYLQSLTFEKRAGVIAAMVDAVNEEKEGDDPLVEIDEGVQWG